MDNITIDQYNQNSTLYSNRYDKKLPQKLYDIIKLFFNDNGLTADIGCGNGRDANYLNSLGCEVTGYDASSGMVHEAQSQYGSRIKFIESSLPSLSNIENSIYSNILCSAVLMHLPEEEIIHACYNLLRIMQDDGVLILSIRSSREDLERESDGRLFTNITADKLILLFESLGGVLLKQFSNNETERDVIEWNSFVIKKNGENR